MAGGGGGWWGRGRAETQLQALRASAFPSGGGLAPLFVHDSQKSHCEPTGSLRTGTGPHGTSAVLGTSGTTEGEAEEPCCAAQTLWEQPPEARPGGHLPTMAQTPGPGSPEPADVLMSGCATSAVKRQGARNNWDGALPKPRCPWGPGQAPSLPFPSFGCVMALGPRDRPSHAF